MKIWINQDDWGSQILIHPTKPKFDGEWSSMDCTGMCKKWVYKLLREKGIKRPKREELLELELSATLIKKIQAPQ